MKRFSLGLRLLWLLLGSLVLVWAAMLVTGYDEAHEEIQELGDAHLQQGARTLLVLDLKRLTRLATSGAVTEPGDHGGANRNHAAPPLAFQVWSNRGQLMLASAGAPPAAYQPQEGYATRAIAGDDWRSYTLYDARHDYQVTVLEPLATREHHVRELAARMGRVLLWALPLLAILVWLSIRHGLAPLRRLSHSIGARDAGNLEPIQPQRIASEVEVLVTALNRLLERLGHSLDRERAFTADAAHELRTPLAAIKVQAEVALAATDAASRRQALQQVIAGVDRAAHLAQQLLWLARLEHAEMGARQPVDLGRLAAEGIARRAEEALRAKLAIELDATPGCVLQGDPATLAVLLDNLLDNAIKYGGSGGHVVVKLRPAPGAILLSVADDGAGVTAADRARLRDRFFRVEGQAAPGSGLGLSIVERIAAAHDGVVEFGAGPGGRGLEVRVRFAGGPRT